MYRILLLSLIVSTVYSCSRGGENDIEEDHTAEIPQKDLQPLAIDTLISLLKVNNYQLKIDTTLRGFLEFTSYDSALKEVADVVICGRLVTINARSAVPVGNTSYYPFFSVQEITLHDSIDQRKLEEKIKSIIYNRDDLFNNKVYDHILFYDHKLLYLKTDARIYEEYVSYYHKQLKEILR